VVLVLALFFGSAASCGIHCQSCDSNSPPICHRCFPNYYLNTTTNTCTACKACPTGQYIFSGCAQDAIGDSVCHNCTDVAPCPAGKYYDAATCGTWNDPKSNGCVDCQDCPDSAGARTKAWGVCGGPSPYDYRPEVECMNPGPALCELCSDYVPEWAFTQNEDPELNISFCTNEKDSSWIFLSGKFESDLITCCHAAKEREDNPDDNLDCDFDEVPSPVAARKSCLYNSVITCMGIYDSNAGGWPLPSEYPDDPLPW